MSYYKVKDALDHPTRKKIYDVVLGARGVTEYELREELNTPSGTLAYHLQVLVKKEYIIFKREGKLKMYYPASIVLLGLEQRIMQNNI